MICSLCYLACYFRDNVLVDYFIILTKMIDVYDCGYKPTEEEIQILLKSLKPEQKLPLLNDLKYPDACPDQLVDENYLDRLLEDYALKFVMNRFINETGPDPYLTTNTRLCSILPGIGDLIERRGLGLHFEWNFEQGALLHNYKPNFEKGCGHDDECDHEECEECCPDGCIEVYIDRHESDKCIVIELKINGTNIECHDYSQEE